MLPACAVLYLYVVWRRAVAAPLVAFQAAFAVFFCLPPTPRVNSFSGCLNVYRQPENALQRQLKRGAYNNAAHARLRREMENLPVFAAVDVIRQIGEIGGNARGQRGEVVFV